MANNKVIFDPDAGVAFPVNLTLNTGADFNATFEVVNTSNTGYNFSTTNSLGVNTTRGWTGSCQMRKSISIGSGTTADATFSVGIDTTASVGYGFTVSLGSTDTRNLIQGRYMYDVLVSSGATIYRIVDGMIYVRPGISSAL